MVTQTTKIKNGTITLPKQLSKFWRNREVVVQGSEDKIVIEPSKPKKRIFSKETEKKLQALGRKITKKDIEEAIAWARGEKLS